MLLVRRKTKRNKNKTQAVSDTEDKKKDGQRASRDASTCLGDTQVPVRLVPVQDSFGSSTRPIIGVALEVIRFLRYNNYHV